MKRALEQVPVRPDYLLLDAFPLPGVNLPQRALIRGDSEVLSIAAASIAAKVERDHLMEKLDARYPRYGFGSNKGYGTPGHLRAIAEHGPCPAHRLTFGRVREAVARDVLDKGRHRSSFVGRHAETVAAGHLRFLGYEVLETNYRTRLGEVDIIALQGGTLVFCEVRARRPSVYGTAEESLTPTKRARLVAAAQDYLQAAEGRWKDWRMDLVAIELDRTGNVRRIRIVENAVEE
jgi:Holliday junction resolvase-like predicted endonuclease